MGLNSLKFLKGSLGFLFILISCSNGTVSKGSEVEELPDLMIKKLELIEMSSYSLKGITKAEAVSLYEKKQMISIEALDFKEFSEDNKEIQLEILSNNFAFNRADESGTMEGNVIISLPKDKISIKTENIYIKENDLTSNADDIVTIENPTGYLKGKGFYANVETKEVSFSNSSEGAQYD